MKIVRIILVLICIGIAWYLGYRARPKEDDSRQKNKANIPRDYLQGLNFLLNEETDKAVDIFVKMLEVDSDTVETHLAVGKLYRRRGEVDRAIRIHQNLIARPQLEKVYREQSLFELGQDYLSAGMLDRAERIFLDLVNAKSRPSQALRALLDIYQQEKDWQNAIDTAQKYEVVTRQDMSKVIAHYYCELAEVFFNKKSLDSAQEHVKKAIEIDSSSVRASLLQAKIAMQETDYQAAINYLKKIKEQNSDYLAETIDLLALCHEALGQEDELLAYFKNLTDEYPHVPAILILSERIRKKMGDKETAHFVAEYVRRYPSVRGLAQFLNLHLSSAQGRAKDDLLILQNLMKKVLQNKPDYLCHSCGFPAKTLHWQCPGCKQWSTLMPVHALEATSA